MGVNNKFEIFAENSTNVYTDAEYNPLTARTNGNIANEVISSKTMNTAEKTASLIAVALVDALAELNSSQTMELGLADTRSSLKTKFKTLLQATKVTNATNADNVYDNKNGSFKTMTAMMLDLVYPVGSIYMSVNNTSPASFLGGTWTKLEGRFLVGSGSVTDADSKTKTFTLGNTGGYLNQYNISHTHTATFTGSEVTSIATTPSMSFTGDAATITGGSHTHEAKFTGTRVQTETDGYHSHVYNMKHGNSGSSEVTGVWRNSGGHVQYTTIGAGSHDHYYTAVGSVEVKSNNSSHTHSYTPTGSISGGSHTHKVTAAGSVSVSTDGVSGTDKNLPPYLVVNMWKRTA